MAESAHDQEENVRARGRPNAAVAQPVTLRPFATPVYPTTNGTNYEGPLPEPKYESQKSMNRVLGSDVGNFIRGSSFQQNRDYFIKLFDEKFWNYPDEDLPLLKSELQQTRALVIAIHYGGGDPLPATYVDALNIAHMLIERNYQPKCIRILADQVDLQDCKDKRWPNKNNIISGLKWLVEGTVPGCRRFLFFAGHGHRLMTNKENTYYTREGILPKDFLTYTTRGGQDVPDPKTVLFDDELNQLLVKIGDKSTLTVAFDAFTAGISGEEGVSQVTYRILNRRIQAEFDTYNKKVKNSDDPSASGSGQNSSIRASKTQNAVQKDEQYQYPKLYVSKNIADIIADREVVI
ncbi:unnamed protein product [Rhizoctonia solani]|uniref:Peptidase C14 caspase domain-containing protein n=1 Tax=Rhizoctonia solani TaxID=456999 RepID=A0A8H3E834_9AGAM|nr:unnamed protein product [Rhizoctonia solani]